jgi:hypothetical protein
VEVGLGMVDVIACLSAGGGAASRTRTECAPPKM